MSWEEKHFRERESLSFQAVNEYTNYVFKMRLLSYHTGTNRCSSLSKARAEIEMSLFLISSDTNTSRSSFKSSSRSPYFSERLHEHSVCPPGMLKLLGPLIGLSVWPFESIWEVEAEGMWWMQLYCWSRKTLADREMCFISMRKYKGWKMLLHIKDNRLRQANVKAGLFSKCYRSGNGLWCKQNWMYLRRISLPETYCFPGGRLLSSSSSCQAPHLLHLIPPLGHPLPHLKVKKVSFFWFVTRLGF